MSWVLKGLAGPLKDKVFKLKPGTTLGRQGDIVVPDTKSSSIHARITQTASGKWLLADNNSKNGTRIDGQRVSSIELADGLKFFIGDQGFLVVSKDKKETKAAESQEDTLPPPAPKPSPSDDAPTAPVAASTAEPSVDESAPPAPEPEPELPPPPQPKPRRYWHEILADFVDAHQERFSEKKRPVSALNPPLVLEFIRGVQVNSKWILGYGPRKVGPSALDLPIFEPGAPAVCFEISPSPDGIVFKTAHPEMVTINGEAVDSQVLHMGDRIHINETIIKVDFET